MKTRRYRLIGKRLATGLRDRFDAVVRAWADDWLPARTPVAVALPTALHAFHEGDTRTELDRMISWVDDNWCGLLRHYDLAHFGAMLTGVRSEGANDPVRESLLLRDVGAQALVELAQRLLSGSEMPYDSVPFLVTEDPLPASALARASGAVVLRVQVDYLTFTLVVSPACVERYLETLDPPAPRERAPLTHLTDALGNQTVRAQVTLGSADLSLSDLLSIRVGDVVALDQRIDQPSSLRFGADGAECDGFIGVKAGRLAFRIRRVHDDGGKILQQEEP